EDGRLTYAELDAVTARVAATLARHGIARDAPVAVLAERGARQLAALLGVMRAGAAYVCLDAGHPPARWLAHLDSSGARAVLADRPVPGLPGLVVALDDLDGPTAAQAALPPGPAAHDVAYILYTSGSTG